MIYKNTSFSSISISALGWPSWFCPSQRAFSGHFRAHFKQVAVQRKRCKSEKKSFIQNKKMFLATLRSCFGNLTDIWFFYRILNFFPFDLLMKRHQKAKFKGNYRQKYITWDPKTTLHLKSNVSGFEMSISPPYPWVSIISQIPTPGDHRPCIVRSTKW